MGESCSGLFACGNRRSGTGHPGNAELHAQPDLVAVGDHSFYPRFERDFPGEPGHGLLVINMMVLTGGRERTASELKELLAGAGFKLKRIIPTSCPLTIVEGHAG